MNQAAQSAHQSGATFPQVPFLPALNPQELRATAFLRHAGYPHKTESKVSEILLCLMQSASQIDSPKRS